MWYSCLENSMDRASWQAIVQGVAELDTTEQREHAGWALNPGTSVRIRGGVVFSRSVVSDSATPWTAARLASLSFTSSQSLLKRMSIESVLPSNHLVLCCLLLLPSVFPSIRVFPSELALRIRWPKY